MAAVSGLFRDVIQLDLGQTAGDVQTLMILYAERLQRQVVARTEQRFGPDTAGHDGLGTDTVIFARKRGHTIVTCRCSTVICGSQ